MNLTNASQYDRVDPAEVQSLKDEIERLKSHEAELQAATAERDSRIAAQIQTVSSRQTHPWLYAYPCCQLDQLKAALSGKDEMAKRQILTANGKASQLREQNDALVKERNELKAQLSKTATPSFSDGTELKSLQVEKAALEKSLAEARASASSVASLNATIVRLFSAVLRYH